MDANAEKERQRSEAELAEQDKQQKATEEKEAEAEAELNDAQEATAKAAQDEINKQFAEKAAKLREAEADEAILREKNAERIAKLQAEANVIADADHVFASNPLAVVSEKLHEAADPIIDAFSEYAEEKLKDKIKGNLIDALANGLMQSKNPATVGGGVILKSINKRDGFNIDAEKQLFDELSSYETNQRIQMYMLR